MENSKRPKWCNVKDSCIFWDTPDTSKCLNYSGINKPCALYVPNTRKEMEDLIKIKRGDTKKLDAGKPMWDLLPFHYIKEIVKVLTFGAEKYGPHQWKELPDGKNRYFAAMHRHLTAWYEGEKTDTETGLPHLAHAGCCLLFLMYFSDKDG